MATATTAPVQCYPYHKRLEMAEALALNLRIDAQPNVITLTQLDVLADMPYGLMDLHQLTHSLFTVDIMCSRIQHGQPNYSLHGRHSAGLTSRVLRYLRNTPGLTASQLVALAERLYLHCNRKRVTFQAA